MRLAGTAVWLVAAAVVVSCSDDENSGSPAPTDETVTVTAGVTATEPFASYHSDNTLFPTLDICPSAEAVATVLETPVERGHTARGPTGYGDFSYVLCDYAWPDEASPAVLATLWFYNEADPGRAESLARYREPAEGFYEDATRVDLAGVEVYETLDEACALASISLNILVLPVDTALESAAPCAQARQLLIAFVPDL